MKRLLLFMLPMMFVFGGCSSDDPELTPEKETGNLSFDSYHIDYLSTGEERRTPQTLELIHIWKADGTDFNLETPHLDMLKGYMYDKNQEKSLEADYSYLDKWTLSKELKPGRYLIYVYYGNKSPYGTTRMSYSYTYFDIVKQEATFLKKYIKKGGDYPNLKYHPWD